MIFREAQTNDIKQIQIVRHTVKENVLSDPALVTDKDCEEFLTVRGKVGYVKQTIRLLALQLLILRTITFGLYL